MRGTLNVILNEREGSVPAVSSFRFPAFSYSILIPAQNDTRRQGVIMRETLNVILSTSEESVAVVRKAGKLSSEVIDSSPCHCPVFCFFHTAFLRPFRMTIGGKGVIMREMLIVILNGCEGSIPVVRQAVSCHQSHRFFTRCHVVVSRFSRTAFLRPFRMTIGGKGVMMRGILIIIRSGGEKFIGELIKTIKRKSIK